MNDALMSVVEKTTTDVLKLKELDKIVVKLHCRDRERNHQSRRDCRLFSCFSMGCNSGQPG